ncbi:hypothetical protein, partial [Pararhizobium sp.]|uniref:hypothetical protein n=1 Tax=Pararhizobium sp. TaxID=1977563 RepID=UPI00271DFC60
MTNDGKYPAALNAHLKQLQKTAEQVHTQMAPLRNIHEAIRKSVQPLIETHEMLQKTLEPLLTSQESWRQVIESAHVPQGVLTDLTLMARLMIDVQNVIQRSIAPAFLELHRGFKELPARTQEASILLGQHGWYLDPEMSVPTLWKLKSAFADGNVLEA